MKKMKEGYKTLIPAEISWSQNRILLIAFDKLSMLTPASLFKVTLTDKVDESKQVVLFVSMIPGSGRYYSTQSVLDADDCSVADISFSINSEVIGSIAGSISIEFDESYSPYENWDGIEYKFELME